MFQFRLRSLFIITTLLAILVGVVILRYQYHWKLQAHYESFEKLDQTTSLIGSAIKDEILTWPEVQEAASYVDGPLESYLAGGYSRSSSAGPSQMEDARFGCRYNYQWPNAEGRFDNQHEVDLSIEARINVDTFTRHVVTLRYQNTPHNKKLADWLTKEFRKHLDVKTKHQVVD